MDRIAKSFNNLAYNLLNLRDKLTHNEVTTQKAHRKLWKDERYYPVKIRTQGVYYDMTNKQLVKLINSIVDDIHRYY